MIGALKTNRIIYPCRIHQKVSESTLHLRKKDQSVSLVTIGSREFYVYHYEREFNDKSLTLTQNDGQSNYFSAKVKINLYWTYPTIPSDLCCQPFQLI